VRVYEALARTLRESGTDVFFGLAGDDTVKLSSTLASLGSRYVGARHECQAVAMADGYARASGKVGVVVISRGPGFTSALTAMVCAAKAQTPVLVVAGDTAIGIEGESIARVSRLNPKHVDQDAICAGAGILSARILSPDSAVADLRVVQDRVRSGCAVSLNVPTDVLEADAGSATATVVLPPMAPVPLPDPELIAAVADLIETRWAARKLVILAGRGAANANARDELTTLGEITGSLLATSVGGNGLFAGDPHDIGICGTMSSPVASEYLSQADLILVFGASLNPYTTYRDTMFPTARLVQVDSDAAAFGRHIRHPDIAIQADVTVAARLLVAELERRGFVPSPGLRANDTAARIAAFEVGDTFTDQSTSTTIDPRTLMLRLDTMLPFDRCLVMEGGHHVNFACAYLSARSPRKFIFPIESFSIGLGIGAAIGAAVGNPDTLTVLEIGDGGLMMTLGDLETAVRYQLPLLVIISNNDSLGSEVNILAAAGLETDVATFPAPSFSALAAALGCESFTVRVAADLEPLRARLGRPITAPIVVDCHVNPDVLAHSLAWPAPAVAQGPGQR
jgi:thiamine pyrophosphate-dependent acetolactate synthase large subunit-like protein